MIWYSIWLVIFVWSVRTALKGQTPARASAFAALALTAAYMGIVGMRMMLLGPLAGLVLGPLAILVFGAAWAWTLSAALLTRPNSQPLVRATGGLVVAAGLAGLASYGWYLHASSGARDPSASAEDLQTSYARLQDFPGVRDFWQRWSAEKTHPMTEIAEHPNTPPELLLRLVDWGAAAHPGFPILELRSIAGEANTRVARQIANNPSAPPDLLTSLASRPECEMSLIHNPSTPPEVREGILRRMARNNSEYIRMHVAIQPAVPIELLAEFSRDPAPLVRAGAAQNLDTPADILASLADDQSPRVRRSVALNRNAPAAVLGKLTQDSDGEVARAASSQQGRR